MSSTNSSGWSSLNSFDLFPKLADSVRVKTYSGAIISLLAAICIFSLFISELILYLSPERVDRLYVDHTSRTQRLPIAFDITFHKTPCPLLTLQTMDVAGTSQLDVAHSITKQDVLPNGETHSASITYTIGQDVPFSQQQLAISSLGSCGRCFGAESTTEQCCNTCEEVQRVFAEKKKPMPRLENFPQCVITPPKTHSSNGKLTTPPIERNILNIFKEGYGCRIIGEIEVSKVAGTFAFSPGRQFYTQEDVYSGTFDEVDFDMSHQIHMLRFGKPYPGMKNPLDKYGRSTNELSRLTTDKKNPYNALFLYYAKIVPTFYSTASEIDEKSLISNQYSVTEHQKIMTSNNPSISGIKSPSAKDGDVVYNSGVVFSYEFSPIMVQATVKWRPFFSFLTHLCAILGGVFTVASLVDKFVYGTIQHVQKKVQLGKMN